MFIAFDVINPVGAGKLLDQWLKPAQAIGHAGQQSDAVSSGFKQKLVSDTAKVLNMENRLVNNDTGDLGQQGLESNRRPCCADSGSLGLTSELGNLADDCRLCAIVLNKYTVTLEWG